MSRELLSKKRWGRHGRGLQAVATDRCGWCCCRRQLR